MDRVRVGKVFRALRRRQHLRQVDLARRVGLSQQTVSDIECGRLGRLSVDTYCRLAEALGAEVVLMPHWRGAKLARLLDDRHASLQAAVAAELARLHWLVRTEEPFNHFGDRGWVDLLAWHAATRTLLIVEIKSEIDSAKETIRILNMKARVVPIVVARELGWRPRQVGVLLVVPEGSTHRDLVERHAPLFDAALPSRNRDVRPWLECPPGDLRGVWFFRDTDGVGVKEATRQRHRIRATPKA